MKIQCDNCSAVFMIDDSLISDRGVKAQCPRCGHQKVVWRESEHVDPLTGLPLQQELLSGSHHPIPSMDTPSAYAGDTVNCFSCGKPLEETPENSVLPICSDCLQPGEDDNLIGTTRVVEPTTISPPPTAPPPSFAMEPSIAQDLRASSLFQEEAAPKIVPGERARELFKDAPESSYVVTSTQEHSDHIPAGFDDIVEDVIMEEGVEEEANLDLNNLQLRRRKDGKIFGPMILRDLCSLYAQGQITIKDEYLDPHGKWQALLGNAQLSNVLRRTPQLRADHSTPIRTKLLWWFSLLILVLGGALTYTLIYTNPQRKIDKRRVGPELSLFASKLQTLKRKYPGLRWNKAKSKQSAKLGFTHFYRDLPTSYQEAQRAFEKALVLDPQNHEALAGLAMSTVWKSTTGKPSMKDIQLYYRMLIEESKRPSRLLLFVLYWLRDYRRSQNKTRRLRNLRLKRIPKHALAYLLSAELTRFYQGNAPEAEGWLKKAIDLEPLCNRAHLRYAQYSQQRFRYFEAEQRIQPLLRKKHNKGLFFQAQLFAEMGYYKKARRLLRRMLYSYRKVANVSADVRRARLLQTRIMFRIQRNLNSAYRLLLGYHKLESNLSTRPSRWHQKFLLQLGYIDTQRGRTKQARVWLAQIRKGKNSFVPADLLEAQILFVEKRYAQAGIKIQASQREYSTPALKTFATLNLAEAGKLEEAQNQYRQLINEYADYIWPYLGIAAAQLKQNKQDQSFSWLRKAIQVEPMLTRNYRQLTEKAGKDRADYYVLPKVWLTIFETFRKSKGSREARPLLAAATGISAYHMHEKGKARAWLRKALALDSRGLVGMAYSAQLYYDQSSIGRAAALSHRLLKTYGNNPIAQNILGWAAFRARRYDKATRFFAQVEEDSKASFISARIGKARVMARRSQRKQAIALLRAQIGVQQQHQQLLRALYQLRW